MSTHRHFSAHPGRRQRGMALIFGMIILLILTLIGITAVRSTTQQQRMASASQQQTRSFEAAESSIHYAMAQLDPTRYRGAVAASGDVLGSAQLAQITLSQPEPNAPTPPANAVVLTPPGSDSTIPTSARLYGTGLSPYPIPGYSMGGNVSFYRFYIDAIGGDPGSGAAVRTLQEVVKAAPASH